jgi:uncharacterized membrane protein YbaN (DUF454 family)
LDIAIDERLGTIRIYDPRLFCAGKRAFCRRVIHEALQLPGIQEARIELDAASCRVQFDPTAATSQSMAAAFSDAVVRAIGSGRLREGPRRSPWCALTGFQRDGHISVWETLDASHGRIRLRNRAMPRSRRWNACIKANLSELEGVTAWRTSRWFRTIAIDFHPETQVAGAIVERLDCALDEWKFAETSRKGSIEVATGPRRLFYLTLAGGAGALSLVALVVPGIPTVPCLMATSYYLARSSPRLNEKLLRARFFGPILREWETYQALSRRSKGKLIAVTVAIVVVTITISTLAPLVFLVIVLLSALSILGIATLPELAEERFGVPAEGRGLRAPSVST